MSSSRRHALPAGLLSFFGTPMDLGLQALQQMNTDPATLSLLDSSLYLALDDSTMSLSLDPRPFATAPTQQHSHPAPFSPVDSTGNGTAPATIAPPMNAPRPRDSPGPPVNPNNNATGSSSNNATHTLTEFTRRRNWPAKVVEELQDLLQILDANGRIKHLSPSAERLTGYTLPELRDVFLQSLLHPDDVGVFTSELNESIASGAPLRVFYRLRRKDGQYAVFEAVGHGHIAAARFGPNPENQTPFCQAVFMMARPYPAKNAALLDSFLEHKMENERLKRKIAELRREEQEEAEESERSWRELQETPPSDSGGSSVGSVGGGAGVGGRPALVPLQHPQQHPQRATLDPMLAGSSSLLRERRLSLDSGSTGGGGAAESIAGNTGARQQQPPSSTTGLSTHADTIEMLTGLRYQEGERSRGITTGSPTPALITGDVGIAIPVDRDRGSGEKKKKIKVAEEYVCTDCGTLESPEWRKGPRGPKTLCNACGLRWAKKEKKRSAHPAEHHAQGDDAAG